MNPRSETQTDLENLLPVASDETSANIFIASGGFDERRSYTELLLPGGRMLRVPTSLFLERPRAEDARSIDDARRGVGGDDLSIPVIEEELSIEKRTVVTGKVLLERQVQEYSETLDVPLAMRSYDIERVILNRLVDSAPPVRQEGDTTIYPVIEEQLVVTTNLILKEEVRVTKRDTERRDTRTVTLKRESVNVIRKPTEQGGSEGAQAQDRGAASEEGNTR